MLKADVSDGFFWIGLRHADAPKRGLIFPIDDVFVDDFLWLAQGLTHRRHYMCRTLFHTLDKVFRPLEKLDPPQRKEVLSLKKLDSGDCSQSTCQVLLGWVLDAVNMILCLPTHQASRLK